MVGNNKRQSIISIGTHLEMTINNFEVNVKEPKKVPDTIKVRWYLALASYTFLPQDS
jgi:hypothetical protein